MFFSFVGVIILILIVMVCFTSIKIDIENLEIKKCSTAKLEYDYLLYIKFYIWGCIKYFQIRIDKQKLMQSKVMQNMKFSKENINLKSLKEYLKVLRIGLEEFKLKGKFGLENSIITSFVVLFVNVFLSFLCRYTSLELDCKKFEYKIVPEYSKNVLIDFNVNCIFKIKLVHIINVIYIVLKKRSVLKNERASNRRIDDGCYE